MAMERLLRLPEPPTAVFAYNDVMAVGALRAIQEAGLKVAYDISIVGFDDIPLASAVWPALTTMAQPIVEMITCAMRFLMGRMQRGADAEPGRRILLDPKLVVRDSCGPPPPCA